MFRSRSVASTNLSPCFVGLLSLVFPFGNAIQRAGAEKPYTPAPENIEARQWFQDAKFGLFIHWGTYSVLGGQYQGRDVPGAEWIMHTAKIPSTEYEQYASEFNPVQFDPAQWVRLAKQAGMKYITITSKHHDGFAMWDSNVSDWDIVDRTPYNKDVLKMLADQCHKQDMKLFFYHSHLDWHHPDYFPRGRTGQYAGRPEAGDFDKYLDYLDAQLAELLGGRYGKIAGIWFDGWWDQQIKEPGGDPRRTRVDWRLRQTYDLIHRLQPQALIGNNHHVLPFEGEDFQMFEKDLPGQNTAGFNEDAQIGKLPLEMCDTTNDSWGYKKSDKNFKSLRQLVHLLVGVGGRNSNPPPHTRPTPHSPPPPPPTQQLTQIGQWMRQYGESIYGTRGGPLAPQPWGVTTHKGNRVYLHILDSQAAHGDEIPLTGLDASVTSARLLKDKSMVRFDEAKNVLVIPRSSRDAMDTVVVLELHP